MNGLSVTAMVLLLLVIAPSQFFTVVHATFSIVAADDLSRQVGGAGASCNPMGDVFSGLYLSAPNRSVLTTQALLLERNDPIIVKARQMMEGGEDSIWDILRTMEDMEDGSNCTLSVGSFPSAELRQYGMADFVSNGGYTGKSLETAYELAAMAEGTEQIDMGSENLIDGRFSYHVMGNDVAEGTVEALRTGFLLGDFDNNDHCAMAQRLMAAMDRVLRDGLGDMRCIHDHGGISATGAYLHVDDPDGRVLVHINKPGDGSREPIEELKREFLQWQQNNGCRIDIDEQVLDTMAEVQPEIVSSTSSSEKEAAVSTIALVSIIGVASSVVIASAGAVFWKVRSYQKKSPDPETRMIEELHLTCV